jgi:hypothetical protein
MCHEEPLVEAFERRFALTLGALRRGQGWDARGWERTLQGRRDEQGAWFFLRYTLPTGLGLRRAAPAWSMIGNERKRSPMEAYPVAVCFVDAV